MSSSSIPQKPRLIKAGELVAQLERVRQADNDTRNAALDRLEACAVLCERRDYQAATEQVRAYWQMWGAANAALPPESIGFYNPDRPLIAARQKAAWRRILDDAKALQESPSFLSNDPDPVFDDLMSLFEVIVGYAYDKRGVALSASPSTTRLEEAA